LVIPGGCNGCKEPAKAAFFYTDYAFARYSVAVSSS
jgi:hypothetical protein